MADAKVGWRSYSFLQGHQQDYIVLFFRQQSSRLIYPKPFVKVLIVTSAPQSYFSKTDVGVTLNRFSQDVGLIDHNLPLAAATCIIRKL